MPHIVKKVIDCDALCSVGTADDGSRVIASEKACIVVGPDGTIVGQWWKEEPSHPLFDAFLNYNDKALEAKPREDDDNESPFAIWCNDNSRRRVGETVEPTPDFALIDKEDKS